MTLHVYRALAAQFILETEAAASHNLIDPTRANWIKAAIEIALDSERRGASGVGSPVTSETVGTDSPPLSAQDTRVCPNGHQCRLARAPTIMKEAGYWWCPRCESEPGDRSMNGAPRMGMFYPESQMQGGSLSAQRTRKL